MKIKKVLNNNAVLALNDLGEEVVVTGLGLAFKKKAGHLLDSNQIERVFKLESKDVSKKLKALINEIPIEYVAVSEDIIQVAKEELEKKLSENIYITLTDHISFAVERFQKQLLVTNPLIWEIKRFYKKEYAIGLKALDLIEDKISVRLPEDEAAAIAMHIVNAELHEEMPNVVNMIKVLQDSLNIIKYHFGIEFDEDQLNYQRLVTHLKFFAQRILNSEKSSQKDDDLYHLLKKQYQESYNCALKIKKYAKEKFDFDVSNAEMTYLIVHIEKVINTHE